MFQMLQGQAQKMSSVWVLHDQYDVQFDTRMNNIDSHSQSLSVKLFRHTSKNAWEPLIMNTKCLFCSLSQPTSTDKTTYL
jgi:hypothetical protein